MARAEVLPGLACGSDTREREIRISGHDSREAQRASGHRNTTNVNPTVGVRYKLWDDLSKETYRKLTAGLL